jgi:hypothetical protein
MASKDSNNNNANATGAIPISPKRHWNGAVGDRHEHQNVWLNGGVKSPAVTSAWAGWDSHRRRASDASTSSSNDVMGSSSSPKSPSRFVNLSQQKRNSTDAQAAERRKSFADQLPDKGFFANMWHGWTRG